MEDDKTPAAARKRATKAKPNDTSNPSAAAQPAAAQPRKAVRPRKVPPATFVAPAQDGPWEDSGASPVLATAKAPGESAARSDTDAAQKKPPAPRPGPAAETPPAKKAARKAPAAHVQEALPGLPVKKAVAAARAATPTKATRTTPPAQAAAPADEIIAEHVQKITAAVEPPAPELLALAALWPTLKANPGYAPELLALAAVDQLAPRVREHLAWLRDTYPTAPPDALVRLAAARSVRQSRIQGAVAGLVGPLAVLAETGVLTWTQARLVLDVAAAYGRDPGDRERAAELLVLLRVHPDLAAARAALEAAGQARDTSRDGADAFPVRLAAPLARALGRMAVARRAAGMVPGAGAALIAVLDGRSTERLAARATKFYRG